MTNVGDYVKCPQCGREARVVWVSQDEKTMAIRCKGYHSHSENRPPPKTSPRYVPKAKRKYVTGMVFIVEASRKSENSTSPGMRQMEIIYSSRGK